MFSKETRSRFIWGVLGVIALLIVWQTASILFDSELILPGPIIVLKKLIILIGDKDFLSAAVGSLSRVVIGLAIAIPTALALGVGIGLNSAFRSFCRPFFAVISATPVLSIILIALLWFGQERTPIFSAFLMVFPLLAANVAEGIDSVDPRLLEMVNAYRLGSFDRLRYLYLPTLLPYLLAGLRGALALSWKVIVAAEVIAQPLRSLGAGMQNAKAQLETAELFAWTVATVVLAAITESVFSLTRRRFGYRPNKNKSVGWSVS